jgi:hypothetical protein
VRRNTLLELMPDAIAFVVQYVLCRLLLQKANCFRISSNEHIIFRAEQICNLFLARKNAFDPKDSHSISARNHKGHT